ncbi:enoyl-CoA hydratase [Mangrovihabitans endophyticus]|uniref:Enoyl-CoA hydratase n=1 Tax=Mangrovihabitans endophyticus TaxID=1751298 RepID=A0A8J3BY52_9ACTN|nr:enoyl-CoA hydratase [Mangrovihabitans endophyticus]
MRYEKDGRVAHVCLDRPEVLNAMNLAMHAELADVWDDFERDDGLWIAVLTGAGERSFSVGQDLTELVARTRSQVARPSTFGSRGKPGWPRLTERFDLVKPVIARVNGYAYGGGFELALACDIIVAAEDASFAMTEARLGLIPGAGGVFRLSRQTGTKIAMGHLLTGRPMTARRAYEVGLVNEVVAAADLDACVRRWTDDVLACAPLSARSIKQVVGRSARLPLSEAFTAEYPAETIRMHSNDAREGPAAFVEKRPPRWTAT